jgi:hypothetical protein
VAERDWTYAHLVKCRPRHPCRGPCLWVPFHRDELTEKGITAGENRVQHLCRDHGIWSVFSKKRGLNRRPGQSVHDDLVERDFSALESFFSLLQKNVLDRQRWLTRQYPDWPSQSGSKEPTTADDGKDG